MTPISASLAQRAAPIDELGRAIGRGAKSVGDAQRDDGHWVYPLEADATIPAEYVLLKHFIGEVDRDVEAKLAPYLRATQGDHGGWPLWHGGPLDISCSVKAYFALKAIGDSADAPHMAKARAAILAAGGAERANVFTRILLAMFEQVPWHAVPTMPVEIMNLPRWFPFHLDKVSYWSRTVIVPLLVIMSMKPRPVAGCTLSVRELFRDDPATIRDWLKPASPTLLGNGFMWLDWVVRRVEPLFPASGRKRAIERAIKFVDERLNGEDGLGAIYPAMANALVAYRCVGVAEDDPRMIDAKRSIEKLVVFDGVEHPFVQPCLSPIWDTGLAAHAMLESDDPTAIERACAGLDWLVSRQVLDVMGDWAVQRPHVRPGGWAFQYANPHYPDVDDTAVVAMAMHRADPKKYALPIARAAEWIRGIQSRDGGWGAFDADNDHYELNHIPFADHGALLDPSTADVTARCISFLAQLGHGHEDAAVARAVQYLRNEQEEDGSWFGRWGSNYVYGTWSVLCALNAAGVPSDDPCVRKAAAWLASRQRADGGWGEDGHSYYEGKPTGAAEVSTASQTAWAVLGLMAAGEVDHPAVARGVEYLVDTQNDAGGWDERHYTAVGFPRVFYLRYHGYAAYFPLWALARYRSLQRTNSRTPVYGM
ncbi:squalene--hopene cyclase [Roseiterribacter gracilis]